jgi:zinc D-Ala-D-Ala carboxypeptidase
MKWFWWLLSIGGGVAIIGFANKKRVEKKLSEVQLSKNFNLSEFVRTSTGIDNIPTPEAVQNLELLVQNILQPLRDAVGKPIRITSGYRSPAVNASVKGSSTTSQHMKGQAADFQIDGMTNQQIIDLVRKLKLPYDQIIDEQLKGKKWIHVSYVRNGSRRAWLTARDKTGGGTLYAEVMRG